MDLLPLPSIEERHLAPNATLSPLRTFSSSLEICRDLLLQNVLTVQKKPASYVNKILQDVLMNYFLENYVSGLLVEELGLSSNRSVRRALEADLPKEGFKYIELLNRFA